MDREAQLDRIKLLVLDVDGVLTAGEIMVGADGELMKQFHVQDGLGITIAHKVGLKTAIITGRQSPMVQLRSAELGIADVYQGAKSKTEALAALLAKYNLTPNEVAYIGDDLNDLPVMLRVGLACAVANAAAEVKQYATLVTTRKGGHGAVREVIEQILKAQGKWEKILAEYVKDGNRATEQ